MADASGSSGQLPGIMEELGGGEMDLVHVALRLQSIEKGFPEAKPSSFLSVAKRVVNESRVLWSFRGLQ